MTEGAAMMKSLIVNKYEHVDLGNAAQLYTVSNFIPAQFQVNVSAKEDIIWGKLTVKFNPFAL